MNAGELLQRQELYRQAALCHKRSNLLPEARQLLATAKSIDTFIEQAELGVYIDASKVPPKIDPNQLRPLPKPTAVEPVPSETMSLAVPVARPKVLEPSPTPKIPKPIPTKTPQDTKDLESLAAEFEARVNVHGSEKDALPAHKNEQFRAQFERLEKALKEQAETSSTVAARYYRLGEKEIALRFYQYRKRFTRDLEYLENLRLHDAAPPRFHYEACSYSFVRTFPELKETEMELTILRAVNLAPASGFTQVDSFLSVQMPLDKEAPITFDSEVVRDNSDPVYNFTRKVPIVRNRALQRGFERRKLSVEVYQYRLLWKSILLGRAQMKLSDLLEKSEVHEFVDVVDANRRPSGAKLEVRLRLRQPLLKHDVVTQKEEWIFLDHANAEIKTDSKQATDSPALPASSTSTTSAKATIAPKEITPVRSPSPSLSTKTNTARPEPSIPRTADGRTGKSAIEEEADSEEEDPDRYALLWFRLNDKD